jgi:hypothetical protein
MHHALVFRAADGVKSGCNDGLAAREVGGFTRVLCDVEESEGISHPNAFPPPGEHR